MKNHRMAKILLIISALLLLFVSCAVERDPINRVQPDAIKKSYFIGEDFIDTQDDPEFWTQGTLVDVGYGAAQDGLFTSTYAQPMSRMKWQITEQHLIGRAAYERINGSDGKGLGGPTNDGIIVVAYEIEKHFDVANDYNSVTGEKINVVRENDSDRPWYEREYVRIDWSSNLNTDSYEFDTLSLLGVYGGISYESLAYDIADPYHPDAPFFDNENNYFDITTKAFALPKTIDMSRFGWGIDEFPACFLPNDFMYGSWPTGNCNPIELTIRQSFRQVVDSDYVPMDWDGYRFQAYGAFTVERFGYARNYGMTDSLWHRFINRYNIWERSHYYNDPENMLEPVECNVPSKTQFGMDPHRDTDFDGTEDECKDVGKGSKCDTFKQKCTLPFADRTEKQAVWYYTNSDSSYFDATADAAHEWDVALRIAVRTAKYSECMNTGGTDCLKKFPVFFGQQDMNEDAVALAMEVDDCKNGIAYKNKNKNKEACNAVADDVGNTRGYDAGVISIAKMDEMIVLCHSPVQANDPAGCSNRRLPEGITSDMCIDAWENRDSQLFTDCNNALRVRMGDLRFHQVNVINEPQTPSPWGIYTDSEDPLTGETIAASINVWAWVNDFISQKVVDILRHMNGELETSEVTSGKYIHNWAKAASTSNGNGGLAPKMTKNEKNYRLSDFAGISKEHIGNINLAPEIKKQINSFTNQLKDIKASFSAPSISKPKYNARAQHAHGTEFEAELMTPMVQQYMGTIGLPINETIMNYTSLLRGGNPSVQRDLNNMKEIALAERGACILHEAPSPLAFNGLDKALEAKFGKFNKDDSEADQQNRSEKMRKYLADRMHMSVILHEMGHSVGLRHNFVSSSDAYSYRPQYWQLRTKNGTVTEECTDLKADGESCIGPRYYDPVTDDEQDNLIWMWMQSSIMDYAGDYTQDMLGLGAWDFAAAKMFYGDTVAVLTDEKFGKDGTHTGTLINKMDNFGGILGYRWGEGENMYHYSQLQNNLKLIKDCNNIEIRDFKPARWDTARYGKWHPVVDGHIVKVDGKYSKCKTQEVDYVPWNSLSYPDINEGEYYSGGNAYDKTGRIRVPYGFGTDSWADLGNLSVYRHDNGADAYELFDFFITQQEVNHIFDNYRRNRTTFSVRSAANRTLGRYNTKMRDGAKGLGLMKNIYKDFSMSIGWSFDSIWPYISANVFPDNILASGIAFDHFTRLVARPEAGNHYLEDGILKSMEDDVGNDRQMEVKIPNGATGYFTDIGYGGKPLENGLSNSHGEYDSSYTEYCGSYYDKMYASMLLTESVDNFISSSRTDFLDARYRSVSLADLFPEGYRRWLGNNLTDDIYIKGARLVAGTNGKPQKDGFSYPKSPIGWTTWWGKEPRACFPADGSIICSTFGKSDPELFSQQAPENTVVIDPQVGWEQQKFLIAWTLLYLPENQKMSWIDSMRIWELGEDADPGFDNRIELHNPNGKTYVAKVFGKETIFGKVVQKGVGARILEYANELLKDAYETEPVDYNNDGDADWYVPVLNEDTKAAMVKYDSTLMSADENGYVTTKPDCNSTTNTGCTCNENRACLKLQDYVSVPYFMRQAMHAYGHVFPDARGVY